VAAQLFFLNVLHFIYKIVGNLQELFSFRLSWDSVGLPAVQQIQIGHRIIVVRAQLQSLLQAFNAFVDERSVFVSVFFAQDVGRRLIIFELSSPYRQVVLARNWAFARNDNVQSITPVQ